MALVVLGACSKHRGDWPQSTPATADGSSTLIQQHMQVTAHKLLAMQFTANDIDKHNDKVRQLLQVLLCQSVDR